jgi:hypothetical protein
VQLLAGWHGEKLNQVRGCNENVKSFMQRFTRDSKGM